MGSDGPAAGRAAGFTMIELIVVVAAIAVLAGIAIPVTGGLVTKSKLNVSKKEMAGLAESLRAYARDQKFVPSNVRWGRFPAEAAGAGAYDTVLGNELEVDASGQGYDPVLRFGWNGPYTQSGSETCDAAGTGTTSTVPGYRVDAWGRYYRYRNRATSAAGPFVTAPSQTRVVALESGGPDRSLSTAGDNVVVEVFRGPAY